MLNEFLIDPDALKVTVKGGGDAGRYNRRTTRLATMSCAWCGHINGVAVVRGRFSYPMTPPVIVGLGFCGRWGKRRRERGGSDEHD